MNISNPSLPAHIKQSAQNIIDELSQSNFAEQNVDLQIDLVGILNYTTGVKLRMAFLDSFEDSDVDEWRSISLRHGATNVTTRVDTSSGNIDLNIEYKRRKQSSNKWMVRSLMLVLISWSYHQLNQLNQLRYPLPSSV